MAGMSCRQSIACVNSRTAATGLFLLFLAGILAIFPAAGALPAGTTVQAGLQQTSAYDIFRNDRHIGNHTVTRTELDGQVIVSVVTRIRISLLGIEFYRFEYDAREIWDEAGLLSLSVQVDDDGEQSRLEGKRHDGAFRWASGREQGSHPMPVYPTNHWNAAVLEQDVVLNTLTGKLNRVAITDDGREALLIDENRLSVTRYRYEGQLQLISWYDASGRWLAMRFTADDGSVIDYRCKGCRVSEDS